MKRSLPFKLCLFLLPFLCAATIESAAQSESEWSVIVYDHGLNALVELSSAGYDIIPLPDIGYPPRSDQDYPWWYESPNVKVSSDRRYLISLIQHTEPYVREAIITDLVTGEIIPIATPPLEDEELFVGYGFGAFNPTMTEIALPYVSHDLTSGFGCCDSGGMVTVELASGTITHTLDMDVTYHESTAWLDDWTTEGIWFWPRCSACTPPSYTHSYLVWNPDTDVILTADVRQDRVRSERLAATGELLYSENHSDFPLGGPSFSSPLNVVVLYQRDKFPPDAPGQVVYYDEENLDFDIRAHWIMNGRAFLVTNERQHNVVVFRDGHQVVVDYVDPEYFLTMTGDGWLTFERTTRQIRHYVVSDTRITGNILYQASGEIEVANVQLSPETGTLPPFAIDITPPDIFFCPGTLPTRLKPGDWAEVIVDHQEYLIASLYVGDVTLGEITWMQMEALPLGAHVQIIEGYACRPGWGYVKVQYQDKVGWMLEVGQMAYYLEPVG
jgi:hypothetical protein